ncbi:MAG: YeeE/YedE family protein, partial [Proteobacteria bacterium]|nr:YeeE/YedE family protein [Pseudomonadota bacterium]
LFSGALASALMSRQFKLRPSPPLEYIKGVAGGIFMGAGAALAGGCNVGGFYTAIGIFSMGGYAMMIGLGAGAWLGLRYLLWEMAKFPPKMTTEERSSKRVPSRIDWAKIQPYLGGGILFMAVSIFYLYSFLDKTQMGGLLFFGLLIGFVMHRARFCFVRAFRCPFMTGDAEMVRVVALSLAIYGIGSAVIKWNFLQPDTMGVYHPFWIGSLSGGVIFGFGMLLAGGCASSTLWRIGEGHIKLMIVLVAFAITNSWLNDFLTTSGLEGKLGKGILVPAVFSWPLTMPLFLLVLLAWVLWAVWNEKTEKCVIF